MLVREWSVKTETMGSREQEREREKKQALKGR